jgi:hypothetical protein
MAFGYIIFIIYASIFPIVNYGMACLLLGALTIAIFHVRISNSAFSIINYPISSIRDTHNKGLESLAIYWISLFLQLET